MNAMFPHIIYCRTDASCAKSNGGFNECREARRVSRIGEIEPPIGFWIMEIKIRCPQMSRPNIVPRTAGTHTAYSLANSVRQVLLTAGSHPHIQIGFFSSTLKNFHQARLER
jgi:hypothetical protein